MFWSFLKKIFLNASDSQFLFLLSLYEFRAVHRPPLSVQFYRSRYERSIYASASTFSTAFRLRGGLHFT